MLAAGLGLAALIAAAGWVLGAVKLAGAAYLIWLGWRMWNRAGEAKPVRVSGRNYFLQGFLTSASNPKAIVFFAALFPQFIDAALPFWPQFAVLSATYLVIDGLFLTAWGAFAGQARSRFGSAVRARLERIGGATVAATGAVLGARTLLAMR